MSKKVFNAIREGLEEALERADPDDRVDQIYDIIKETTGHGFGLIEGNPLRLGIRKALNLFYNGPDTAAITLKKELDRVEANLRQVMNEKEVFKSQYLMMKKQLDNIRYMLNHPEYKIGEEQQDE